MEGVSSVDILYEENFDRSIETALVDEEIMKIGNLSMDNIDTIRFYDDPREQMNGNTKCSVTNILEILQDMT